ncbi:S8 family serine peptidase [Myxococcota bacterium]|nr:S8 family serine peptidase [Myxococcota bacterium]
MRVLAWFLGAFVFASSTVGVTAPRDRRTPLDELRANLARGNTFEPGELLVRTTMSKDALVRVARNLGCAYDHGIGQRPLHILRCDPKRSIEETVAKWQVVAGVSWVEAAFHDDQLEALPDDLDPLQWYHHNTGQTVDRVAGTAGADMGSADAWDVTTGARERVVAIIDVGLYAAHLDLAPQIWSNGGETCGNGRDDDGNGYVDDCSGWDFGEDDRDPSPLTMPEMRTDGSNCLRWHATYIAGLAGAAGNNGRGVTGTAWNVSLMNIKRHIDDTCRSTTTRTVEAVAYALDNGADAIGMSFNSSTASTELENMLQEADVRGMIAVMSAGNGGTNDDTDERYPNNYDVPGKIIVASTDNRDRLDDGSNYGARTVHIGAPGTYVVSTAIEGPNEYGVGTGTSMSVGFVLGAIALGKAAFPGVSGHDVRTAIFEGGEPLPSLDCAQTQRCVITGRRLDLFGMLSKLSDDYPSALTVASIDVDESGPADGVFSPGERGTIRVTLANGGTGAAHAVKASLALVDGPDGIRVPVPEASVGGVLAGSSIDVGADVLPSFEIDAACAGIDYTAGFELTFTDKFGRSTTARLGAHVVCPSAGGADAGVASDGGAIEDAGSDPNGEPIEEGSAGGCTSTELPSRGPTPFVGLALVALVLAARKR